MNIQKQDVDAAVPGGQKCGHALGTAHCAVLHSAPALAAGPLPNPLLAASRWSNSPAQTLLHGMLFPGSEM